MPPDVKPVTVSQPESWYNPYRLKFEGTYSELSLGENAPKFSGAGFQASVGRSFELSPRNHLFIQPVFRVHFLKSQNNDPLSIVHFGLEGGYELQIIPKILGAYIYAGIGSNFFSSAGVNLESNVRRALNNQATLALEAGGGITFARGIFHFSGGGQFNPVLEFPHSQPGVAPRGYSGRGLVLKGGIDGANLIHWLGKEFPTKSSLKDWISGIKLYALADSSYTFNFNKPANGENTLRIFDKRADRPMWNYFEAAVERPVDEKNPLGFRIDFGFGENSAVARAKSSFSGQYYDLQQFYAMLRLPIGKGLTIKGGKIAAPGFENIESPLNKNASQSWQFGLGQPYTLLGALLDYPFSEKLSITTGVFNGFDNVLDRSSGLSWLGALTVNWSDNFSTAATGTVGKEGERLRGFFDTYTTFKYRDATAKKHEYDRLTITADYTYAHETAGGKTGAVDWHAFSLNATLQFVKRFGIAWRGEVFHDPQGARSGTPQTLGETTVTAVIKPWDWLLIRPEFRHDRSNKQVFVTDTSKINSQNTLALSLAFLYGY